MKRVLLILGVLFMISFRTWAQENDEGVKMKYVYSFEEAIQRAKKENKLIFFNCFADWAHTCHAMNRQVFSNQKFADWMDKHFVNLFIDVTTPEGRPFAEKYQIRFQAHYLMLDSQGEIVLRIVGGGALPEFQEQVALALSPKTSLKGLREKYEQGDRSTQTLKNYATVLKLADEEEVYQKVAEEYFAAIKESDWCKKENWKLFSDLVKKLEQEKFKFLMEHRTEFVKQNGKEAVVKEITNVYAKPIYCMAVGIDGYDNRKLLDWYMELQNCNIPEEHEIFVVYNFAKYRGEGKIDQMVGLLENVRPEVDQQLIQSLDLSLGQLEELTKEQREHIVRYLSARVEKMESGKQQKCYKECIYNMTHLEGIDFVSIPFEKALKKAKTENKLIFMDCYTNWCGPCKMMARQVFTQKWIGDFFNANFINLKIDMEKGEGVELAKKYGVTAFPTMFLLDGDGNVVYKILGGAEAREFMKKIQRGISPEYCYYQLLEKYGKGETVTELVPEYFLTMGDAGILEDQNGMMREYLKSLKGDDVFSLSVWKLYDHLITSYKEPEFLFLCEHRNDFAKYVGEEVVNKKIEQIVFPVAIEYLRNGLPKAELNMARSCGEKAELPEQFLVSYLFRVLDLYEAGNYGKLLDFYENQVVGMTDAQAKLNLDILLDAMLQKASVDEKGRAIEYVKKCLDQADPRAVNSYSSLLKSLSMGGV